MRDTPADTTYGSITSVDQELEHAYQNIFQNLLPTTSQPTQLSQTFDKVAKISIVDTCYGKDLEQRQEYKFLKEVTRGSKLSRGSYGTTFLSTYKGRNVVEKQLDHTFNTDLIGACIFNSIDDEHLMKTYDYKFERNEQGELVPVFVMEYCGDSLADYKLHDAPDEAKLSVLQEIAIGLSLLHENGVCHGDLKTNNVCLDGVRDASVSRPGRVVLIDAGLVGAPNGKHFMDGERLAMIMSYFSMYRLSDIIDDLKANGSVAFKAIKYLAEIDVSKSLDDINDDYRQRKHDIVLSAKAADLGMTFDRLFELPNEPVPTFTQETPVYSSKLAVSFQITTLAYHVDQFVIMSNGSYATLYLNTSNVTSDVICGVLGTYIFELNRPDPRARHPETNKFYMTQAACESLHDLGFVTLDRTTRTRTDTWKTYLPTTRSRGLHLCLAQDWIPQHPNHPNIDI
jgi:tRNA A-37 threonylcarbamoyl transferase component Bud32